MAHYGIYRVGSPWVIMVYIGQLVHGSLRYISGG